MPAITPLPTDPMMAHVNIAIGRFRRAAQAIGVWDVIGARRELYCRGAVEAYFDGIEPEEFALSVARALLGSDPRPL